MGLNTDDEILQDFLVEAGELLEGLSEQLVELERNPADRDLLNAVFRGFHTIKGGAGFLNLNHLVTICHRSEDVFNLLRQGQREVDADLMDAVLQVLDAVNGMFAEVRSGEEPGPADADLLDRLRVLADPQATVAVRAPAPAAVKAPGASAPAKPSAGQVVHQSSAPIQKPATGAAQPTGDITDEEFEALLDAMDAGMDTTQGPEPEGVPAGQAATAAPESPASGGSDEITEDEFERLLEQMHGSGSGGGGSGAISAPEARAEPAAANAELMTEDEFERLLDQFQGQAGAATDATDATAGPAVTAVSSASGAVLTAAADPGRTQRQPAEAKPPATGVTEAGAAGDRLGAERPAEVKSEKKPAATAVAAAAGETTVRVDTKRLDDIMNLVGELVLVRNRLATLRSGMRDEQVAKAVSNLDVVTADLQAAVMKTRMQPIKKVFGRFPRVVRDLARSLKKEIELELQGEETDLDKNLVEALADPLVHLVRNAVDHGIELPEERVRAGKPRVGRVVLAAAQEGDHILLTISDDGKGMDPDILRSKAVEKGLLEPEVAARLSDSDAFNLIFMAGFSTKTEISDVSGRGVGMDVVKTRIAQLNGRVDIESVKGQGSILRVKVPLTLAILPTLMVVLGNQRFALPLASVSEIFNLDLSRTNHVDDQEVVMVRNHALPLFYLRHWLVRDGYASNAGRTKHVVVVFVGNRRVGLVVDRLIGQEEVVIKPLGAALHGLAGFAGATITGDGGIALILDVPSLLRAHGGRF